MLLALLGLLQLSRGVLSGEAATDGTGLLGAEVEGHVLLVLEEQAHVVSLLGVDDGEDTSDRLAEIVAVKTNYFQISLHVPFLFQFIHPMVCIPSSQLGSFAKWMICTECSFVGPCMGSGIYRVVAHILFSLVPEEAIFWIRSWPSSVLSSPRVLVRSSRFFDHSWPALILLLDCNIVSYTDFPIDNGCRNGVVARLLLAKGGGELAPKTVHVETQAVLQPVGKKFNRGRNGNAPWS